MGGVGAAAAAAARACTVDVLFMAASMQLPLRSFQQLASQSSRPGCTEQPPPLLSKEIFFMTAQALTKVWRAGCTRVRCACNCVGFAAVIFFSNAQWLWLWCTCIRLFLRSQVIIDCTDRGPTIRCCWSVIILSIGNAAVSRASFDRRSSTCTANIS